MRVLLFRNLCDRGGVSSSMLLLGREMEKRGIEGEYWFLKGSDRLPDFEATGRVTVAPLSALAARLERGDVDVVQMTASDPAAEVVSMMARVTPAKVLVTARGALADIWDRTNCFAYSAISKGMATVNQPYTDVQIEVVRNAIDIDRFAPATSPSGGGAPIVAFVGRTSDAIKDFPRFTRIASRLVARGARVWIADPHRAGWETFVGKPVEQVETERWEQVPHESIADFYRAVAASGGVVLMTSRHEGFGNVAPEAAACGAWVVAPDVMGLNEAIIDGVTGNLFPADASDDDAAELIAGWMSAPRDSRQTSDAARREFSSPKMMDAYESIYSREQQLLFKGASPVAGQRYEKLDAHLAKQRTWRAAAAREAAIELAGDGRTQLALGALGIAFRAEPSDFLSKQGFGQLLSTMRRIPRRRAGV
ncbi:MAG: glycosyltransferase family 4 protein [Gemmatimonadaceae bacterium]